MSLRMTVRIFPLQNVPETWFTPPCHGRNGRSWKNACASYCKEKSTPSSDERNPKQWINTKVARIGADGAAADNETTLDLGARIDEVEATAQGRIAIRSIRVSQKIR